MKRCSKCQQYKEVAEFHKNCAKKDGYATECKLCKGKNDQASHLRNRDKRLKMMNEYRKKHLGYLNMKAKKYARCAKGREVNLKATKKYYSGHRDIIAQRIKDRNFRSPEKYKARYQFSNAIKLGHITRPAHCQMCYEEGPVQGHHEDYDKPFDVIWVCIGCHGKVHRKETCHDNRRQ